jgi:hypothetical protein
MPKPKIRNCGHPKSVHFVDSSDEGTCCYMCDGVVWKCGIPIYCSCHENGKSCGPRKKKK